MSRHRATRVRPRYARMGAAFASRGGTMVAVLGGFGVLPVSTLANASYGPPTGQSVAGCDSAVDAGDPAPGGGADEGADKGAGEGADKGAGEGAEKPRKSKGTGIGRSADSA